MTDQDLQFPKADGGMSLLWLRLSKRIALKYAAEKKVFDVHNKRRVEVVPQLYKISSF